MSTASPVASFASLALVSIHRRVLCSSFTLGLAALAGACVHGRGQALTPEPTMQSASPRVRTPSVGLPFHRAAIVEVALIAPGPGQRWRMVSADVDGWLRVWADGRLVAATQAHLGGVSALQVAPDGVLFTAGFDGRVIEWRDDPRAGAPVPARAWELIVDGPNGRRPTPVTAMAVSEQRLAISDGHHVQLWSRPASPGAEQVSERLWSMPAEHFVTGLALSAGGGVVAAAELRTKALRDGLANHPLATFPTTGLQAVDPQRQYELRWMAERDFPGARADIVEVWQPSRHRQRLLEPQAPIDSDLGLLERGGVVYREIWDTQQAWMMARRLEDSAHVSVPLVKPWPFWSSETPEEVAGLIGAPVGDFTMGPGGEVVVVDLFAGWQYMPTERGWQVGDHRELAVGHGYAALGDKWGNLAVAELSGTKEPTWQAPAEELPELLTSAAGAPLLATAVLEPRARYRLFDLAAGVHRLVRIEHAGSVLPPAQTEDGSEPPPSPELFPIALAVDRAGAQLAISEWSFSADETGVLRLMPSDGSSSTIVLQQTTATGFALGLSPGGEQLLTWGLGDPARAWSLPSMQPLPEPAPGKPLFSANGRWAASASPSARTLVARTPDAGPAKVVAHDPGGFDDLIAAVAEDGTLAVVQPFAGGILELIRYDDPPELVRTVELPGAATALTWVAGPEAPVLMIGFEDGSIARLDVAGADVPVPAIIDPGQGGRVWALTALGPGSYAELDDDDLTLHRLIDDATVRVHVADTTALQRHAASPPQDPRSQDLVAVWTPGAAMPPCRVLDGSRAGVLLPPEVERWAANQAGEFFAAFFTGGRCGPPTAEIPPTPTSDAPTSDAPTSDAPTSDAPTSDAPTSDAPTSDAPQSLAANHRSTSSRSPR